MRAQKQKTTKLGCRVGFSIGNVEEEGVKRWGNPLSVLSAWKEQRLDFPFPAVASDIAHMNAGRKKIPPLHDAQLISQSLIAMLHFPDWTQIEV